MEKKFDINSNIKMPSKTKEDGVDFVPTKALILFGHHFSSIAGAGPIVGPITAALLFGWLPAVLWCVIGCIFIGAMHDFAALVISAKNLFLLFVKNISVLLLTKCMFGFVG